MTISRIALAFMGIMTAALSVVLEANRFLCRQTPEEPTMFDDLIPVLNCIGEEWINAVVIIGVAIGAIIFFVALFPGILFKHQSWIGLEIEARKAKLRKRIRDTNIE